MSARTRKCLGIRNVHLNLTFNNVQTKQAFAKLKGNAPIAIMRSLNRSAASGKTIMVREISADLGMKATAVRDTISIVEARPDKPRVQLISIGKRIPLIDLGAKGPEPSRGRGRGVSYKLGGTRRKLAHAFIARMGSGHRGVFARTSRARLPVVELRGPSIPHVFRKFRPLGLARMREQLVKNLQHEFRYYTDIRKAS
jgi:hypothetical protein